MKGLSWTIFGLMLLVEPLHCYNILFMLPFSSKSHKFAFDPVGLELAKRGHHVTFITGVESIKDSPGVHNIQDPEIKRVMENSGVSFFDGKVTDGNMLKGLLDLVDNLTIATYESPFIVDILKNPRNTKNKPKFDLLVIDAVFNEFSLPLAQRMQIPVVYMSPGALNPAHAWSLNIPHPYSYIPTVMLSLTSKMTFSNRLLNSAINMFFMWMRDFYMLPRLDTIIQKYYPEARPIRELEREVSLIMSNSHFSLQHQIPSMPYFIEVGGLNLVPAKRLPKELDDFLLNSGEHGVIYFSLGSQTKGDSMPLEMRKKIIAAFKQLPQKILWKYEQDIKNLPKNIKLIKWAPQQDLIGHPQVRLFITHGGGMSTQEAAYHSCPIVGFPLSADQEGNIANAVSKGYGESLDWRTFTTEELVEVIKKVINNKRYKDTVTKISKLMKDRPQSPVDTAAYWIEYVIRHNGAPHLKSGAENLNFFQYFLLDVISVVALVLIVILSVSYFVFKKLLGLCGINFCPLSWCKGFCCQGGWCSKTGKNAPKGHSKKE